MAGQRARIVAAPSTTSGVRVGHESWRGKKSVRRHGRVPVRQAPAVLDWLWLLPGTLRGTVTGSAWQRDGAVA